MTLEHAPTPDKRNSASISTLRSPFRLLRSSTMATPPSSKRHKLVDDKRQSQGQTSPSHASSTGTERGNATFSARPNANPTPSRTGSLTYRKTQVKQGHGIPTPPVVSLAMKGPSSPGTGSKGDLIASSKRTSTYTNSAFAAASNDDRNADQHNVFSWSDTQLAECYHFDREVGFGNWGSCWLAVARHDARTLVSGKKYAIKLVHRQGTQPSNARVKALWNEYKVLRSCGLPTHPNLVQFKEFIVTPSYALVVMDYYKQAMNVALPTSLYAGPTGYFQQLMSSIAWLHQRSVTHCDIKVANLLVDLSLDKVRGRPILVDFGFATLHDTNTNFKNKQTWGTPEYLSPERSRGEMHDERLSDMWALGVTFFEIATGRTPFEHEDEQFLTKEQLDVYYKRTLKSEWVGEYTIPDTLEALCKVMLSPDPSKRIFAQKAVEHPFFSQASFGEDFGDLDASLKDELKRKDLTMATLAKQDVKHTSHDEGSVDTEAVTPPHSSPPSTEPESPVTFLEAKENHVSTTMDATDDSVENHENVCRNSCGSFEIKDVQIKRVESIRKRPVAARNVTSEDVQLVTPPTQPETCNGKSQKSKKPAPIDSRPPSSRKNTKAGKGTSSSDLRHSKQIGKNSALGYNNDRGAARDGSPVAQRSDVMPQSRPTLAINNPVARDNLQSSSSGAKEVIDSDNDPEIRTPGIDRSTLCDGLNEIERRVHSYTQMPWLQNAQNGCEDVGVEFLSQKLAEMDQLAGLLAQMVHDTRAQLHRFQCAHEDLSHHRGASVAAQLIASQSMEQLVPSTPDKQHKRQVSLPKLHAFGFGRKSSAGLASKNAASEPRKARVTQEDAAAAMCSGLPLSYTNGNHQSASIHVHNGVENGLLFKPLPHQPTIDAKKSPSRRPASLVVSQEQLRSLGRSFMRHKTPFTSQKESKTPPSSFPVAQMQKKTRNERPATSGSMRVSTENRFKAYGWTESLDSTDGAVSSLAHEVLNQGGHPTIGKSVGGGIKAFVLGRSNSVNMMNGINAGGDSRKGSYTQARGAERSFVSETSSSEQTRARYQAASLQTTASSEAGSKSPSWLHAALQRQESKQHLYHNESTIVGTARNTSINASTSGAVGGGSINVAGPMSPASSMYSCTPTSPSVGHTPLNNVATDGKSSKTPQTPSGALWRMLTNHRKGGGGGAAAAAAAGTGAGAR